MSLLKHQIRPRRLNQGDTWGSPLAGACFCFSVDLRDEARNRRLDGLRHHKRKKSIPLEANQGPPQPGMASEQDRTADALLSSKLSQ